MGGEPRQRRVLWATLLGILVASFTSVILVAALPDIAEEFGVGESSVGWVLTAPMIARALLVPLFGKLGDLRGHRRVFLVGFTLSGVLAALTAAAPDLGSLIVLRTMSQAAGVATGPTALALLLATHGPTERPKALGAWAFVGAASPVFGLLAGGPLIDALSWRGLFAMQALLALVTLPLAISALPETPRVPSVRFDVLGGLLLVLGSGSAVFALDRSASWGATSPGVVAAVLLCPLAIWAFVRVERRVDDPLVPLALARGRAFVAPVLGDSLIQIPSIGAFFIAPLVLHATFDMNVGQVAYYLIPMPLGMAIMAPIGGRLTVSWGERRTSVVGCLLMIAALGISFVGNEAEVLLLSLTGFTLHGAAMGLNRPSFAAAAAGALHAGMTGIGMAVMRMFSALGSAAGVSLSIAARAAGGFGAVYGTLAVVASAATVVTQGIVESAPDAEDVAMAGILPALDA
jgi:MFS family permease